MSHAPNAKEECSGKEEAADVLPSDKCPPGGLRQALGGVATQRAAPEGNPVQPLCHRTGRLGACAARKKVYKG